MSFPRKDVNARQTHASSLRIPTQRVSNSGRFNTDQVPMFDKYSLQSKNNSNIVYSKNELPEGHSNLSSRKTTKDVSDMSGTTLQQPTSSDHSK